MEGSAADATHDDAGGVYHCVARCVRGAPLLCQRQPDGTVVYDRRAWAVQRLAEMAELWAADIGAFAIMDNHLHVVVRLRPQSTKAWSPQDISSRWRRAATRRLAKEGADAAKEDADAELLDVDPDVVADLRTRLGSLSWFMRGLCEPIARVANLEDQAPGRFWEGRFHTQALLDTTAVLACCLFVDLNPVRRGEIRTIDAQPFTSLALRSRGAKARHEIRQNPPGRGFYETAAAGADPTRVDQWLAPLAPTGRSRTTVSASKRPLLDLRLEEYLELADWTATQLHADKPEQPPAAMARLLERFHLRSDHWLECVTHFGNWFRQSAGRPESLLAEAQRRGRRWVHGLAHSRRVFS